MAKVGRRPLPEYIKKRTVRANLRIPRPVRREMHKIAKEKDTSLNTVAISVLAQWVSDYRQGQAQLPPKPDFV